MFVTSAIAKKRTPRGLRRGSELAFLATLAGAAVLAVLASGCGGGSGPSESQIRERLEAGVAKVGAAPSLEATANYEVERDGSEAQPVECLVARVERGPPTKLDLAAFDSGCEGGDEGHEVIAIRNRAWTAIGAGEFAPATVDPSVPIGIVNEEARFKRLLAAGEGFEGAGEDGRIVEPDGESVKAPKYLFTAPASSFYDSAEAQLYSGIGEPQRIAPPPRAQVSGPLTRIENRKEFEAMLGATTANIQATGG